MFEDIQGESVFSCVRLINSSLSSRLRTAGRGRGRGDRRRRGLWTLSVLSSTVGRGRGRRRLFRVDGWCQGREPPGEPGVQRPQKRRGRGSSR